MRRGQALLLAGAVFAGTAIAIGLQALAVRKRIPRLPVAKGMQSGWCRGAGGGDLRLLVVGESSAVGVGVRAQRHGLAGQVAALLGKSMGTVRWRARGHIGATVRDMNECLAIDPSCENADVAIVILGVNDTLRLSTPLHWYRQMRELQRTLLHRTRCRLLVLAPVPPLWKFKSLPQPLRGFVGLQAYMLDRVTCLLAAASERTIYVPIPLGDQDLLLAPDRFHPSRAGYAVLADYFAAAITHASTRIRAIS